MGCGGVGEGIEAKSVYGGEFQEAEVWIRGSEMGQIMRDYVVAYDEVSAVGKVVQLCQCLGQAFTGRGEAQGLAGVRAYSGEVADAVVLVQFEV